VPKASCHCCGRLRRSFGRRKAGSALAFRRLVAVPEAVPFSPLQSSPWLPTFRHVTMCNGISKHSAFRPSWKQRVQIAIGAGDDAHAGVRVQIPMEAVQAF
jgi:hypothetical protein